MEQSSSLSSLGGPRPAKDLSNYKILKIPLMKPSKGFWEQETFLKNVAKHQNTEIIMCSVTPTDDGN